MTHQEGAVLKLTPGVSWGLNTSLGDGVVGVGFSFFFFLIAFALLSGMLWLLVLW